MNPKNTLQRLAGVSILFGGLLILAATLMHPPATNPWAGNEALAMVDKMRTYWQWDHALMLTAVLLWLGGWSAAAGMYQEKAAAGLASGLFVSGLTIWMLILAMEMTVTPVLSGQWARVAGSGADAIGVGLFAFGIMAGDLAMLLAWLGICLLGGVWLGLKDRAPMGQLMSWIGIAAGIWGAIGIPAALLLPDWSLVLLPLTAGPVFVWTLVAGWMMARKNRSGRFEHKREL